MAQHDSKAVIDESQSRLAVLIDAENAKPSVVEGLFAEIAKFGTAAVRRIYGDWTSTAHAQWKAVLLKHSIAPIQQFAYTKGKNSTDSALIIDAMDLMYTRRFTGFCLVSSDSDFTRLAQRLREEGLIVYGFGEQKTPQPFVSACDKFVYTELISQKRAAVAAPEKAKLTGSTKKPINGKQTKTTDEPKTANSNASSGSQSNEHLPLDLIVEAIEQASDESGWARLAVVGSYLTKIRPGFDPRLYGCAKLSILLRARTELFHLAEMTIPGGNGKALSVRLKRANADGKHTLLDVSDS